MELADILSKDSVLTCAALADKADLLDKLAAAASKATGAGRKDILKALMAREELGSTGLGSGIAIPHGKLAGLKTVVAVFARLSEPLDFDAIDDQPVDLVMMLLAPIGSGADHLKALARVARLLRTDWIVDRLRATDDPNALYTLLTEPAKAHAA